MDLIFKILVSLFIAASIGFVMAWLIRGLGLQRARESNAQLSRGLAEKDAIIYDRDIKIKELRSTLAARDSTISAHETRLSTLDTQITELHRIRDRISLELSSKDITLKSREASLASLTALLATRDHALSEAHSAIAQKERALIDTQDSQTLSAQNNHRQLGELQKQMVDKDTMLKVRDETLKSREQKIEDLERAVATLNGKLAVERDQANQKVVHAESNQTHLLKAKDAEISRLTAELAPLISLPILMAQKEAAAASARTEADRARADANAYKSKLDSLQFEVKNKLDQFNQLSVELEASKRTLASRSQLLTDAQAKLATREIELAALREIPNNQTR